MTNLTRSTFQAHPFHLVSPSPWPLYTCGSLLTPTTTGVLTMHGFSNAPFNSDSFVFSTLLRGRINKPRFFSSSVILKTSNDEDYDLSRRDKLLKVHQDVVEDIKDLSNLNKDKISKSKNEILGEEYEKMSNYADKYMKVLSKDKKVINKIGKEIKYDEQIRAEIESKYKDTQEDTSTPGFLMNWLRASEKAENSRRVVSRNLEDLIYNAMKKRLNKNSQ